MKAKKYIIDTEYGEVTFNFLSTVSNEEIENGIIPQMFGTKADFEYVGIVTVPDNFIECNFEIMSPEDHMYMMEEEYGEMCPGIGY